MADTLIRLYVDTKKPGICSAASCRAPLDWYRTLNDKGMPMNRGAAPRDSTRDGGGRAIGLFSSADSHWATCPARQKFGRQAAQPEQPKHRAYFGAAYDRTTDRWHWTISVHTNNHAKEVARSTVTFPTAHDANTAWKTVAEQLKRAEPSRV